MGILHALPTSGPGPSDFLYSYDGNDNILTNNESGQTLSFSYDAANRITTNINVSGQFTTFSFDPNGNQVGMNQNGTLTTMGYDMENRLTNYAQTSAGTTNAQTFQYDGLGKKKTELVNGAPTTLVWDGEDYLQERQ